MRGTDSLCDSDVAWTHGRAISSDMLLLRIQVPGRENLTWVRSNPSLPGMTVGAGHPKQNRHAVWKYKQCRCIQTESNVTFFSNCMAIGKQASLAPLSVASLGHSTAACRQSSSMWFCDCLPKGGQMSLAGVKSSNGWESWFDL